MNLRYRDIEFVNVLASDWTTYVADQARNTACALSATIPDRAIVGRHTFARQVRETIRQAVGPGDSVLVKSGPYARQCGRCVDEDYDNLMIEMPDGNVLAYSRWTDEIVLCASIVIADNACPQCGVPLNPAVGVCWNCYYGGRPFAPESLTPPTPPPEPAKPETWRDRPPLF